MSGASDRLATAVAELGEYVQAHGSYLPGPMIDGWLRWVAAWERWRASPSPSAVELDAFAGQLLVWSEQFERRARASGVQVGLFDYISPSRARARMDTVNAGVQTLDGHIRARRAALGQPFVQGWTRWRESWVRFYEGYPRDWDWWYLGNASAWRETLVFQERLGDWRRAAERAGVRFTVPRPQSAPESRPSSWLSGVRDVAVAGAVGVVAIGAMYLVSRVS